MLARGDFLTPWFNGQHRFEKPILFYRMQALFFAVLGPTAVASRLPAALAGAGCVLLTYLIGARLLGERAAWVGALALATLFRFVTYARQGLTDVPVLLFEMLALWGFWRALDDGPDARAARRHPGWAWAAIGAAALTKGPVAALPLLISDDFRAGLLRLLAQRLAASPDAQTDEARIARRLALRDGGRCVVAMADLAAAAPVRAEGAPGRG